MKRVKLFLIALMTCTFMINHECFSQEETYEEYKKREATSVEEEVINSEKNDDVKGWSWSNLRVGGNFGLQFGSRTYIEMSPTIGYQINKWLQMGLSSKFIYFSQRDNLVFVNSAGQPVGTVPAFKSVIGGIGTYAQFFPYKGLFIHTEYELINKEPFNPATAAIKDRINVSHLMLGGGYAIPMGQTGTFNLSALVNVLENEESIYSGTFGGLPLIIRMGFNIGFGGGR